MHRSNGRVLAEEPPRPLTLWRGIEITARDVQREFGAGAEMILNLCGLIRQTEGLFGSDLPYFQSDLSVGRYQLKIGAVGGDQPGTVRARGERDKHVEMQVSQLMRREPFIATNIRQQPPGLQPIILCWSQDAVVLFECSQEIPLNRLRCATPQLRQNDGG